MGTFNERLFLNNGEDAAFEGKSRIATESKRRITR